jgi:hypothetical protein
VIRQFLSLWRLAPALFGVVSCAPEPAGPGQLDYAVELLGSKSAFESFSVSAEGLEGGMPRYTSPYYARRFVMPGHLACDSSQTFMFTAVSSDGTLSSQQTLSPFLCGAGDCASRLAAGEQGQETHQLFLEADGQLLANTDFERRLSYVCEWRSADGEDVDGSASFQAHAGKCTDSTRVETALELHEVDVDEPWGTAEICNGYLVGSTVGVLVAQVSFGRPGETAQLSLGHCLALGAPPLELTADMLRTEACPHGGASLVLIRGAEERQLQPVAGTWYINELDTGRDGRQSGELNMTFGSDGTAELQVSGTISLPNVQMPEGTK